MSASARGELSFYNAHLVENLVWLVAPSFAELLKFSTPRDRFADGGLVLAVSELADPYLSDSGSATNVSLSYADKALFSLFVGVQIIMFVLTGGLWYPFNISSFTWSDDSM